MDIKTIFFKMQITKEWKLQRIKPKQINHTLIFIIN